LALSVAGVYGASAFVVSLLHQGIGQWFRPAIGSIETSAQISRNAERVEPPSRAQYAYLRPNMLTSVARTFLVQVPAALGYI
jgi:hypothetical protein